MSNVNTNANASARIELARNLTASSPAAKENDVEKEKRTAELMNATMVHPVTGRVVKQAYFGESLPKYGITLLDWVNANYVSNEVHEAAIASKSAKVKAPVIK